MSHTHLAFTLHDLDSVLQDDEVYECLVNITSNHLLTTVSDLHYVTDLLDILARTKTWTIQPQLCRYMRLRWARARHGLRHLVLATPGHKLQYPRHYDEMTRQEKSLDTLASNLIASSNLPYHATIYWDDSTKQWPLPPVVWESSTLHEIYNGLSVDQQHFWRAACFLKLALQALIPIKSKM